MDKNPGLGLKLDLLGLEEGEEPPRIAAYAVDRSGRVLRKLAVSDQGSINLDRGLEKERQLRIGFGPDLEDIKGLRSESLMLFRVSTAWERWQKDSSLLIPRDRYLDWIRLRTCVSGRVRRCRPFYMRLPWPLGDFPPLPEIFLPPRLRCSPVCDGIVEVYQRTCCCRRRLTLVDINDLLKRLREIVLIPIPIPDPDPGPLGPVGPFPPGPGPDPVPLAGFGDVASARSQTRFRAARSSLAGRALESSGLSAQVSRLPERPRIAENARQKAALSRGMTLPFGELRRSVTDDISALESIAQRSLDEAEQYIELRPYLWPWICRCTSRKLGETTLEVDGGFTFCWRSLLSVYRPNCYTSYYYKVRQRIGGVWVYVYDGAARHEYFGDDDFADIETFAGRSCNTPDDDYDHDGPFVLLEGIGSTPASELISHWGGMNIGGSDLTQISEDAVSAPPANGGLAFPPDPGDSDANVLKNCPWGGDLALRLHFSQEMKDVVHASFYRVTFIAADDNGQPQSGATPTEFSDPLSWNYYVDVGGQTEIQAENLGPFPTDIGGGVNASLYRIPFPHDHDWTTDVIHHAVFRTGSQSGKFLVYVEVFDAGGARLTPAANGFNFLRRLKVTGPDSLSRVGFNKLANYFWVDNRRCVGDIIDLRKNGVPSLEECQFKSGPGGSLFSVGYRAYHETVNSQIANPHTFMWTHGLTWTRGLNGPQGTFDPANNQPGLNQPASLSGGVAESGSLTFADLLDTDTVGAKCTFSVYLRAYAKHTNGSSRLYQYDGDETASFALEIV